MNISIKVNKDTCIKCGKCVKVCPAAIFVQGSPASEIELQNVETCIKCGHCVAICPTSSVMHSIFPPEKVHRISKELLPSSEQMMMLIKSRRSNRTFSKKPVPEEMFDQILEAAHRAPTASNMQQVSFTLVTDPLVLEQVIDLTVGFFREKVQKLENPVLKPILKLLAPNTKVPKQIIRVLEARAKGQDPILRGATALLLIHTPEESRFGLTDANLAYQNGSLMAESLGVSQVYTGFLCTAISMDKKRRLYDLLKIKGTIHAGMALGMPAYKFENYIDKKEIKVSHIRKKE